MNDWQYFELTYCPMPSGCYSHGYWYAYAEPGYDGDGLTPEAAMGALIVSMAKALEKLTKEQE